MAKYLDTSQISSELMQLLKEAKEKIILVTYSLQVNTQIQERLKTKSRIGTLSEISIIYGNTKPKKVELEWMKEIDDLRVWQKKNLHAKCYINENKAIISSMNLYDYSQTTNVEMGVLITKNENPLAFEKLMEDIADLKINGDKLKSIWDVDDIKIESNSISSSKGSEKDRAIELSYSQQVKKYYLENFRQVASYDSKLKAKSILSDSEIIDLVTQRNFSVYHLGKILKSDKKVKKFGEDIISALMNEDHQEDIIGKIIDTRYQSDEFSYDQIKMLRFDTNKSDWYDTKKELPKKGQIVAVSLNKNWFNDYFILKETSLKEPEPTQNNFDFSNSNYLTTKELSSLSGVSSREINQTLVTLKFMHKKDSDWYTTNKGELYGGVEKNGQYGQFVVWPDDILKELEL